MEVISEELEQIINNEASLKSIATVSRNGIPHSAYKDSLHIENGLIVFYDLIQSSQTNKNLVQAIWFDGVVAVNVITADKKSYIIEAKPIKCVTCGRELEQKYVEIREKKGDVDINAIWYLQPVNVKEQTYITRLAEEEKYPVIRHLDRLLK